MVIPDIPVPHQTIIGPVKVVLDDRAGKFLFQRLPHGLKMRILRLQHGINLFFRISCGGKVRQIAPAGVNVYYIRGKGIQFRGAEHGILPVLCILTLIKFRLNTVLQQKKPQLVRHLIGGGPAQDCNFFVQRMGILCQQFPTQPPLFAQQCFGIQRIMEAVHVQLLLFYSCANAPFRACAI